MKYLELFHRFLREESAQDVVEYAFLAGFIGVTGYVVLQAISGDVLTTYTSWLDTSTGVPSLWDPADPVGSGS